MATIKVLVTGTREVVRTVHLANADPPRVNDLAETLELGIDSSKFYIEVDYNEEEA
jgi:hypothetical protein